MENYYFQPSPVIYGPYPYLTRYLPYTSSYGLETYSSRWRVPDLVGKVYILIGLCLTVFELWPFEIWVKIRAKRENPLFPPPLSPLPSLLPLPRIGKRYIHKRLSGSLFRRHRSHRCAKSSSLRHVRKLWTAICRVSDVVATRSIFAANSTQLSRKSSGINSFVVRREILFVKVNNILTFRAESLVIVARSAWTTSR